MGEKCECSGHHHEHTYSYQKEFEQFQICVYCHESAVIGAVRGSLEEYYSAASAMLKKLMAEIAGRIVELEGTIGHIKSFVRSSEDSCMMSITDADEVSVVENKEKHTEFDCTAIVFGVTEKQVFEVLADIFKRYLMS